jgi:hypothetical protein
MNLNGFYRNFFTCMLTLLHTRSITIRLILKFDMNRKIMGASQRFQLKSILNELMLKANYTAHIVPNWMEG